MKKILVLAILVLSLGAGAYWTFTSMASIPKKSVSTIISSLQKTKDIDKLYTGTYLIPVIDEEWGLLKRDYVKEGARILFTPMEMVGKTMRLIQGKPVINEAEAKRIAQLLVVKGYCFKKYEVAVGYDHLMQLLNNEEYINAACKGNLSALPAPQILAVNCRSTESRGKYDSSGQCYGWDSNDATRKSVITKAMQEEGILEKVSDRGKESLKNFLSAFCS